MTDYSLGCRLPVDDWVSLNTGEIFDNPDFREYVAPFPPMELMHNVSGLESERDFAKHGGDIYEALNQAAGGGLTDFESTLDFGCGCGRLARMFKGHPHKVSACDIDPRHIAWVGDNLPYISATLTDVSPPLPYDDCSFDAIISISVFTHLNEKTQAGFLAELSRISKQGGRLYLTVHGECAMERAKKESKIRALINVDEAPFQAAQQAFGKGEYAFILQQGHLTRKRQWFSLKKLFSGGEIVAKPFEYGITFVPEAYIRKTWSNWFDIVDYRPGAIHSFQDIVVLEARK